MLLVSPQLWLENHREDGGEVTTKIRQEKGILLLSLAYAKDGCVSITLTLTLRLHIEVLWLLYLSRVMEACLSTCAILGWGWKKGRDGTDWLGELGCTYEGRLRRERNGAGESRHSDTGADGE